MARIIQAVRQLPHSGTGKRLLTLLPIAVALELVVVYFTIINPDSSALAGSDDSTDSAATTSSPAAQSNRSAPTTGTHDEASLDVSSGWELVASGPHAITRVRLADGRMTRTPLPEPSPDAGQPTMVAGSGETLLTHEYDDNGYLVPNGKPARKLPAKLADSDALFPAPDGNVWAFSASSYRITQRHADGTAAGKTISLGQSKRPVGTDGRGNLVIEEDDGSSYLTRSDGLKRITTGELVATGPTRFLTRECDAHGACAYIRTDREDDSRKTLRKEIDEDAAPTGTIAPDGETTAVPDPRVPGVGLIDLSSGKVDKIELDPNENDLPTGEMSWSPDSRWLFTASGSGGVSAIDTKTQKVHRLDVGLSDVERLTVREAQS